ncbi:hypothetical protein ATANTOWER_020777 [Ataeniobius toweri]|uniref:CARD domain-containing protein n=1 Tax=Ataeniobius toweri TaxID=208326 RepID=A0ABU7A8T9_9TELE|nr:hypothetical protein [Ataeniobius toweri]
MRASLAEDGCKKPRSSGIHGSLGGRKSRFSCGVHCRCFEKYCFLFMLNKMICYFLKAAVSAEQARNAGLTTSADAVSNAGASQQAGPQSSNDASSNGQRFVDKYRIELTNRVGNIGPILDKLLVKNVIRDETYGQINAKSTKVEKIRALYDGPLKGGTAGKDIFSSILKGEEHFLIAELKGN